MTYVATLTPSHVPLEANPFLEYTNRGLFAAPWLGRPDPLEIVAAQRLARSLAHPQSSPADWTPALSALMNVRHHCLQAAAALDPIPARHHYGEALKACRYALNLLHHATEGPEGALAAWALGVHTLIMAQLAMPDLVMSERLAREAVVRLSLITDPMCAGAEADAHAATLLAREPSELTRKLEGLVQRVADKVDYFRHEIDRHESNLNGHLAALVEAHGRAFRAVLIWGALNLALMLSLPLNGRFAPEVPWSLPFVVAVPALWWLTWDRPFRGGLRFFDWIRWIKQESVARFTEAAHAFPHPGKQYRESVTALLREARTDRELLAAYHLFTLPSSADTVDQAAALAEDGKVQFAGEWLVDFKDTNPWPLADVLQVQPLMLPNGVRIFYGQADM
ncbi:MAG TPA: hypothetical protein VNT01_05790 [Symbiobacteriaceae bacterium]|nr:hypothetical protein [Symbiobacteriaceae bacterium]